MVTKEKVLDLYHRFHWKETGTAAEFADALDHLFLREEVIDGLEKENKS